MERMEEGRAFPEFSGTDFMEILDDESEFQDLIFNPDVVQGVLTNDTNFNGVNVKNYIQAHQDVLSPLSSVDDFDQNYSGSDTNLADLSSPGLSTDYGYQYSPSSTSIDSGVPNSIHSFDSNSDSPQLSPDPVPNYLNFVNQPNYTALVPTNEDFLVRLVQQQVQQVLAQQQMLAQQEQQKQLLEQQKIPLLQQQQQQIQQQLLRLTQQQQVLTDGNQSQQNPVSSDDHVPNQTKNDSQLRKMLMQTKSNLAQTKNTILNSFQDKKGKIFNSKHPKHKQGKRKVAVLANSEKPFKIDSQPINDEKDMIASTDYDVEQLPSNNLEELLNQPPVISQNLSQQLNRQMTPITPASESVSSINATPKMKPANIQTQQNVSDKLPIQRLKMPLPIASQNIKHNKIGCKRPRIEHVVIEKRYRMKITDSLNELKLMLACSDDKKATKNSILKAAIDEIKALKRANQSLTRKNRKMRKLFEELRNIGIIPASQTISTTSGSNTSEENQNTHSSLDDDIEPEINQDHYASPLQRQSARDGAKLISCFTIFMFLFVNPLNFLAAKSGITNGPAYTSRHLLSIGSIEQETSPQYFLFTNVINIILSFFIVMFMLVRGNPSCAKNSKLTVSYQNQMRKAQLKINKHNYEDAKGFLCIALFGIGNSCPKSFYGQLASFLWKCCSHILYQLGIVTMMKSIAQKILPDSLSLVSGKADQENAAKLSAEAYRKLHEVALKDPSSTYLEAACYLMNAIYSAEVSGDHELLCTAYATAVIHMKERVWYPSLLQYYFTGCAHHVSLASKDSYPFAVDWIFERRGYEYFANGSWDIQAPSQFFTYSDESNLDEPDLIQMVYAQFQEYLLLKAMRRIVVPDTYYRNEGKIELRQRAISFLDSLGTGPVSEHLDNISIYHQSLYGCLGAMLKNLMHMMKSSNVDQDEMMRLTDMYEEIDEHHRHELVQMLHIVLSGHISVQLLKHDAVEMNSSDQLRTNCHTLNHELMEAYQKVKNFRKVYKEGMNEDNKSELSELIVLLCCELLIKARYTLWQIDGTSPLKEEELEILTKENQLLQVYSAKYHDFKTKFQDHHIEIQSMSGFNDLELERIMKRTKHVRSVCSNKNDIESLYYDNQQCNTKLTTSE